MAGLSSARRASLPLARGLRGMADTPGVAFVLPDAVREACGEVEVRAHHSFWHLFKNAWHTVSPDFKTELQERFPLWGFEGISERFKIDSTTGRWDVVLGGGNGSDFLFMHNMMVKRIRMLSGKNALAWQSIPKPGDALYPVPMPLRGSVPPVKTDEFFTQGISRSVFPSVMAKLEAFDGFDDNVGLEALSKLYRNPDFLRTVSLSDLGAMIESTVHDWMHMRWAEVYRTDEMREEAVLEGDYLGNPFSSHVNPVFWLLHGWIDDCIGAWVRANDVDPDAIPWTGKWTGRMPMIGMPRSAESRLELIREMQELCVYVRANNLNYGQFFGDALSEEQEEIERAQLEGVLASAESRLERELDGVAPER